MRKFGYSEHCVYTGAMLSFICILSLVSGDSILGTKVSGFDSWRFIFGAKVSVLVSGNFHLERLFIWVFWKSMRSMVMLQRGVRRNGV